MGVVAEGSPGGRGTPKESARTDGGGGGGGGGKSPRLGSSVTPSSSLAREMVAIEEDAGAEAEVGVAQATITSNQNETIRVEVTWKITDFAQKMRVQDSATFTKVRYHRRGGF